MSGKCYPQGTVLGPPPFKIHPGTILNVPLKHSSKPENLRKIQNEMKTIGNSNFPPFCGPFMVGACQI